MLNDSEKLEGDIRSHWQAGAHERAAALLLQGYGREILGFLISRLRDAELANEVFSTFTEDLWRGMGDFRFGCSARAWSYTLARRAASRHLKSEQRRRRRLLPLSQLSQLSRLEQQARDETQPMLKSENKQRLASLREQLSAEDRELLLLRVNRRLDWRDIARVTLESELGPSEAALVRETARLRKRFQLIKAQLHRLACAEGLLAAHD